MGQEIGKGNGLIFVDDGEIVFYAASFTGSPEVILEEVFVDQ